MISLQEQTQILYEISIDIGGNTNLHQMLNRSLQTILKKLNCIGTIVLADRIDENEYEVEEIYSIPINFREIPIYKKIVQNINVVKIPGQGRTNWNNPDYYLLDNYYVYYLDLIGYGVLVLLSSQIIETNFLRNFKNICEKFSQSIISCENSKLLKISQENLRATLNSIGDAVIATDLDGKITNMNPIAENLTGWKLKNAKSKNIDEVFNIINSKTRKKVQNPFDIIIKTGKIVGLANHTILISRTKTEYQISDSGAPIFNIDGNIIGVVLVFRDVTKDYQMQEAIIEERNFAQKIIKNATSLICGLDHLGIAKFINPIIEKISGYNENEIIGKNWWNLFYPGKEFDQIIDLHKELKNGDVFNYEMTLTTKNGEKRNIIWNFITKRNPNGELIELIGFGFDITQRLDYEKNLIIAKNKAEESDRLKTAFLQNMSHEIRTPMNAIMGFSSLLLENHSNYEKLNLFTGIINQRCKDLLDIINDILDISKIESGQYTLNIEVCNVNELFKELSLFFKDYQDRIHKSQIDLIIKYLHDNIASIIKTDPIKLKQILINLISNAFKFTESGFIEIGFYPKDKKLLFYVKDTGIGIPGDKFDFIFDRFAQIKNTTVQNIGGTGLGLSIVKGLVGLLGGNVWLESVYNSGTTFFFTIDYIPCNEEISKNNLDFNNYEHKLINKSVLIVEDDEYNSMYLKEILQMHFENIYTIDNGLGAVEFVKNSNVDIILMDVRLPDITGYEATKKILSNNPSIKVIAQTAYAANDERMKALSFGCVDYLSKPTKKDILIKTISKYIKN